MINFDSVLFEAAGLGMYQTMSMTCPACHGGASGDGGFYVTRKPYRYAYICHRASCGIKGYISTYEMPTVAAAVFEANPPGYTGSYERIPQIELSQFKERFGIHRDFNLAIERTPDGEYLFPVYGRHGDIAGHVLRRRGWRDYELTPANVSGPKTRTYPRVKPMPLVFPTLNGSRRYGVDTLILVEDVVSALRIDSTLRHADYQPTHVSVSPLLGTNLGAHHLAEMQQDLRVRRLLVALDPDMWKKSLDLARDCSCLFPEGAQARLLRQDPKDFEGDCQALLEALGIE